VARCTLLYPGLLGPAAPLQELPQQEWPGKVELPHLSLLFNRGKESACSKTSLEQQILSELGYRVTPEAELPIAALRQPPDVVTNSPVWCLDPVYVQLDQEMAYLTACDELMLSESEARDLIGSLNRHFGDELHLQYQTPQHWLVSTQLELRTRTPSEAMLQDIRRFQPTGKDAVRWQGVLNEIQMLLHTHPVNEARIHAGLPPVNSLWLWGGGDITATKSEFDLVCAKDVLAIEAAARNKVAHVQFPEQIDIKLFAGQNVLLIETSQLKSVNENNVYAWFSSLRHLDKVLLSPLFTCLKTSVIEELQLLSDTVSFIITKKMLNKWWRRQLPVYSRVLELRQRYGH
jgi:hypothetical protein